MKTKKIRIDSNDNRSMLSITPFTYEWWLKMAKKAYYKADKISKTPRLLSIPTSLELYYWEVVDYCIDRAKICKSK